MIAAVHVQPATAKSKFGFQQGPSKYPEVNIPDGNRTPAAAKKLRIAAGILIEPFCSLMSSIS